MLIAPLFLFLRGDYMNIERKRQRRKTKEPSTKNGRPTKLTIQKINEICHYIEHGNYLEVSAHIVGLSKKTVYNWLQIGKREREQAEQEEREWSEDKKLYAYFSQEFEKAHAMAEARDVAIITKASETVWQASAWRLERRTPQRWAKREHITAQVENVNINEEIFQDQETQELVKELYRKRIRFENGE